MDTTDEPEDETPEEEVDAKKKTPKRNSKKPPPKRASSTKKTLKKEEEDEYDDDEDEEDESTKKPKRKSRAKSDGEDTSKKRGRKSKTEEEECSGRKWWEENDNWRVGKKKKWKWRTVEHNGVYFTPPYVPHGVKMLYDGKEVDLTPEQEEWATYFSRYLETDHMQKEVFSRNFFNDWKEFLGEGHVIKEFRKCDFRPIHDHFKSEQEKRKARTKEEKEAEKNEKAQIKEKHGFAIVDGNIRSDFESFLG